MSPHYSNSAFLGRRFAFLGIAVRASCRHVHLLHTPLLPLCTLRSPLQSTRFAVLVPNGQCNFSSPLIFIHQDLSWINVVLVLHGIFDISFVVGTG